MENRWDALEVQKRLMADLSQHREAFQERLGITKATWNNWASGRSRTLAPLTLARIAGLDEDQQVAFTLAVEADRVARLGRPKGLGSDG